MTCDARIKPFPGDTILQCEVEEPAAHEQHSAVLKDYAYPGSRTKLSWMESDRRTFRGDWISCDVPSVVGPCTLPRNHRGECAA